MFIKNLSGWLYTYYILWLYNLFLLGFTTWDSWTLSAVYCLLYMGIFIIYLMLEENSSSYKFSQRNSKNTNNN